MPGAVELKVVSNDMEMQCGPIFFSSKFDSGNLRHVEQVDHHPVDGAEKSYADPYDHDYEFNLWTSPDAAGTEYENGNRTWFYFSVRGSLCYKTVKFNIMNMNKQSKLFSQGMSPVYKVVPSKNSKWQRIREKPTFEVVEDQFRMSFVHRFVEARFATYFAFCYPFSYSECQQFLNSLKKEYNSTNYDCPSDIYFHCDTLCHSNDGLNVDLLTVSSMKNITSLRESNLPHLFPDDKLERAHIFKDKKVFFLSSRVHPGETPASFVFNGFLKFILRKDDNRAAALRDNFVFKMIPMLNPDGVVRGHYRTDRFGKNLNRMYLQPDPFRHPSIYAVKSLIGYLSSGETTDTSLPHLKKTCTNDDDNSVFTSSNNDSIHSISLSKPNCKLKDIKPGNVSIMSQNKDSWKGNLEARCHAVSEDREMILVKSVTDIPIAVENGCFGALPDKKSHSHHNIIDTDANICTDENSNIVPNETISSYFERSLCFSGEKLDTSCKNAQISNCHEVSSKYSLDRATDTNSTCLGPNHYDSHVTERMEMMDGQRSKQNNGIHIYVDLHGHASKRGCFIYGNYFEHEKDQMQCMLYPKLISVNTAHFDFQGCNFSEKNMYHRDKRDGQSKEGSGRVAISKTFGIIHSYTLECNYNSGRSTNCISYASGDDGRCTPPPLPGFPPRYTIDHYEEVGRAMAVAALDLYDMNPWSRLPLSEFRSLVGVQEYLLKYIHSSPKCVLSLSCKKRGKSNCKSKWVSPAPLSFSKTSVTKIDNCGKGPKISNSSNLPNVIPSNTNSKLFHLKFNHKNRSKSMPHVVSKPEKNLQRNVTRYAQGKVLNVSKVNTFMFQENKDTEAAEDQSSSDTFERKDTKDIENVKELPQNTYETTKLLKTSLNRKNASPRIWNKKAAQVPTIVNISSNNRFVNPLVETTVKKENSAINKKHYSSQCNSYIKPIRLPSKKALSTARL